MLDRFAAIAVEAGEVILQVYARANLGERAKADGSPVTEADAAARRDQAGAHEHQDRGRGNAKSHEVAFGVADAAETLLFAAGIVNAQDGDIPSCPWFRF